MNIGDIAVWNDGKYKTGTIVDYNPLRKVWIVEVDDIFMRNLDCEQYEEVAEDKIIETVV